MRELLSGQRVLSDVGESSAFNALYVNEALDLCPSVPYTMVDTVEETVLQVIGDLESGRDTAENSRNIGNIRGCSQISDGVDGSGPQFDERSAIGVVQ